jgi:hypothetical protein
MPGSSSGSEPTPPSGPSSAPSPRRPRGALALAFALVAGACCWNLLAAPFALLTALGAVVLAVRALRRGSRRMPAAALAIAVLAAVASGVVLAAGGGAVGGPDADLGVQARSPEELRRLLDEAAARSREARARAERELERLPPEGGGERGSPAPGPER